MKKNYFVKCMVKFSYLFVIELFLAFILARIIVCGNDIIGNAIDDMLNGQDVLFLEIIKKMLLLTMAGFVAAFVKSIAASFYSILVQTKYKELVGRKLYSLEYKYFDVNGSGSVINKVNTDIAEIDGLLSENLIEICTNVISIITYAVYIAGLNYTLLLVMAVCYPVLLYVSEKIARKMRQLKQIHREKSDLITDIAQDSVSGILVLRTYLSEEYFQKKLDKAADDMVENEEKRTRISNKAIILRRILQWIPNILCSLYAFVLVSHNNLSVGGLVTFVIILDRFVGAFVSLPFNFVDVREKWVCIRRIENILNNPDEQTGDHVIEEDVLKNENTVIEFENVHFSYETGIKVLDSISFKIDKGSNVAFVGESGGGKSTIFHLLCGFYEIDGGCYRLFGRDFSSLNREKARKNIALVSQNVFLFPTTILENIKYAKQDATFDEVVEACRKARIHDFIESLPDKYNTLVGERGILLSGGEKQRISIARAFLKNAPVLLLDEPTSSVDVETEKLIQEAIDNISNNRTCITIAHRLSTIINADKIFVLKDGKIAESGTHQELISNNSVYSRMYVVSSFL